MKKAIILLSGGLDSTTVLAISKNLGFENYALSFSYGQRHEIELESAKKVAARFLVKEHKIAEIDLRSFGKSALTDEIPVPKDKKISKTKNIPVTYVPARNTIFLSYALAYAEIIGSFDIFIGANAVDYSNYPDCRPEFINAFEKLANLATAAGIKKNFFKIHAPLILMTKRQIIKKGIRLGVNYFETHSCYDPMIINHNTIACGRCDSCKLRLNGFRAAGMKDPLKYFEDQIILKGKD
jgi:7-cyano-7-deazaguanine synthase